MSEEGFDIIECPLPALFTVVKEINQPRIPSLKGLMKAKSAKITVKADAEGELVNCATVTAIPRVCVSTLVGKPQLAITKTGPATAARKIRHPATTAVAAKCTARIKLAGASTPAPNQSMIGPCAY